MLKFIKSKYRSALTNEHFTEVVRTALMMEAVRTSETSVNFNVTTRRYIPEDSKLRHWLLTSPNVSWLLVENYINQIKCFVLKTRTLLKVSWASSTSDVSESRCGHPWHIWWVLNSRDWQVSEASDTHSGSAGLKRLSDVFIFHALLQANAEITSHHQFFCSLPGP
jgi:hypothetical protein